MAATAAAIAAILGTVITTGATVASTMGNKGNPAASTQNAISAAALQDARNNDQYQKMLSTLINQRTIAGSTDQYGSTLKYDPATNQWVSSLGAQPKAVQDASDLAAISRNTTDLRQSQFANEAVARRAALAEPMADRAIRDLGSFRPMGADTLAGLLQSRATAASDATFRPLVSDTLRSFQRTGTAAGPVLASLGKQQYDSLRDSLMASQIQGLTGVDQINQSRRQGLEQSAANASTLATPQFQYPGINPSSNRDTLANLVAARSQQGGIGPAYGAGGVNAASKQGQDAYGALRSSIFQPSNADTESLKQIGSALQNKDFTSNLSTVAKSLFGGGSGTTGTVDGLNVSTAQQYPYYNPGSTDRTFGS
jgi:hypothetical protein